MNDKPSWQVARLDDMERRGGDVPVREHLGIREDARGEDDLAAVRHDPRFEDALR